MGTGEEKIKYQIDSDSKALKALSNLDGSVCKQVVKKIDWLAENAKILPIIN